MSSGGKRSTAVSRFEFLGFLFICGKTRRGACPLQRKTHSDRMRTRLQDIEAKLRQRMHAGIPTREVAADGGQL